MLFLLTCDSPSWGATFKVHGSASTAVAVYRVRVTHNLFQAGAAFPCTADIVGDHHAGAPTMSRPGATGIRQPFVTIGGGALPLPLPMPAQPATLTATRVATKAMSTFFIGVPLSSRHAMHTSCLAAPLVARCRQCVHCLRRQWGTFKGDCVLGDTVRCQGKLILVRCPSNPKAIRPNPETRGVGQP